MSNLGYGPLEEEILKAIDKSGLELELLRRFDLEERFKLFANMEAGWCHGIGQPLRLESALSFLDFISNVREFKTHKFLTMDPDGNLILLVDVWELGKLEDYDDDEFELVFLDKDKVRLYVDVKGILSEEPTVYTVDRILFLIGETFGREDKTVKEQK